MERFPDNLPPPLLRSHRMQKLDGVVRTRMESGRTFARRDFSDTPNDFTLSWQMDQAQAFQFELWHANAIKGGALEFIMPVMMSDGMRDRVCKFLSMYEGPNKTGPCTWEVSASVQVRDQVGEGINPDWWQFPQWIEYASLFDITMNKHWPEA